MHIKVSEYGTNNIHTIDFIIFYVDIYPLAIDLSPSSLENQIYLAFLVVNLRMCIAYHIRAFQCLTPKVKLHN